MKVLRRITETKILYRERRKDKQEKSGVERKRVTEHIHIMKDTTLIRTVHHKSPVRQRLLQYRELRGVEKS